MDKLENIPDEVFFRSVLDNLLEGCQILGFDWRYIYINNAAEIHNRRPNIELLGKKYMDMWPGIEETEVFRKIANCLTGRVPDHIENEFVFPEGSVGWFDLSIQPVNEGVLILSIDITQRKKADLALRESRDLITNLACLVPGVIYQYRLYPDGRSAFPFSSPGMYNIYEVTPEEVREDATPVFGMLHPDDYDHVVRCIQESAKTLNTFYCEFRVKLPKQGVRWRWSQAHPMLLEDGSILWHGIISDITEKKQAEAAIKALNEELEQRVIQRTTQLEAANNELEAFSYSVSHDLRAPLRGINGFTQILIEDYGPLLDDEGRRLCSIIQENSRNMGLLIDDLLKFSRLSRSEMQLSVINMQAMVNTVFHEITDENEREKIDLNVGSICNAKGDQSMLKQVWVNLLSNAIKYSSGKNKSIISVECRKINDECVFSIKDNGVGFDMKYADKLFGVFQRLHGSKEFEGTGVGLAIVQRIIHRHGGRVWAEAEVDKGAIFSFSLPILNEIEEKHITCSSSF